MMNLKISHLEMQAKERKSDDNRKDYPTLADLMKEQNLPIRKLKNSSLQKRFRFSGLIHENNLFLK